MKNFTPSQVLWATFGLWFVSFLLHGGLLAFAYIGLHTPTMLFCYMMWRAEKNSEPLPTGGYQLVEFPLYPDVCVDKAYIPAEKEQIDVQRQTSDSNPQ